MLESRKRGGRDTHPSQESALLMECGSLGCSNDECGAFFEIEMYGLNRDDNPYDVSDIEKAFGLTLDEFNLARSGAVELVDSPVTPAAFYRVRDCLHFYPGRKVWRLSAFWGIHEFSEETALESCSRLWVNSQSLKGIFLIAGEELVYPDESDVLSQKSARELRKLCGGEICITRNSVEPAFLSFASES